MTSLALNNWALNTEHKKALEKDHDAPSHKTYNACVAFKKVVSIHLIRYKLTYKTGS